MTHALRLQPAISAWRRQFGLFERCEMALKPEFESCARLSLSVNRDGASLNECVRQLAELLRLVELMTRPGVDPSALHQLSLRSDKCPLGQERCVFCDDVDGHVVLSLSPKHSRGWNPSLQSFPAIVQGAIFEWNDETMASPEFRHLRDVLLTQASGATRIHPVKLSIDIDDFNYASTGVEDLQSLLFQLRDAAAMPEFFHLQSLSVLSLNRRVADLLVACKLPVEVHGNWETLWDADTGDMQELNMTMLHADARNSQHAVETLYRLVHAHASQLKTLRLWHGWQWSHNDQQRHETEMQAIGRTLFAPDSALSLDKLCLTAPLAEDDLQLMLAPFESTSADSTPPTAGDARHRGFGFTLCRLSTIQGATLGRLLMRSGGVKSLVLTKPVDAGFSIAQIPPLLCSCPSLQSLTVEISCNDWEAIPENALDAPLSIASLELHLKGDATVTAIDRLLSVVGPSLESLSIQPSHSHTSFSADLAAVVARRCPALQELRVRCMDERFLSTLVELYTTQAFRPKRLSFVTGNNASIDFLDFLLVLSTPAHPMARVLQSLHIDACGQSEEEIDALEGLLKSLLNENTTLRDVRLKSNFPPIEDDIEKDEEIVRRSRWATQLPPLRHRLAALSALRRLQLPVDVLAAILTLSGRPAPRFHAEVEPLFDAEEIFEQ
ncbi:hypothetical protein PINS_up007943 [Pythium insidiosum]|nr:hypothetical protein PINS_up007943 [Pythium insidiosum]